jgi:predicted nucleic acid-binding protein
MKVLLDTNIVVDILSKREGYETSLQILRLCETKMLEGYFTTVSVTNIMYILRKHAPPEVMRESLKTLLAILGLSGVTKSDVTRALSSAMSDFEDGVQAEVARRIKADIIVTRNIRDFTESPVPAMTPEDFIVKLKRMA